MDFNSLARFACQIKGIQAHGPITQERFLKEMGIEYRVAALLENISEDSAEKLITSYERLVDPEQMGRIFKALALTSDSLSTPAAF